MTPLENKCLDRTIELIESFDYLALYKWLSDLLVDLNIEENAARSIKDGFNIKMVRGELPKLDQAVEWIKYLKENK